METSSNIESISQLDEPKRWYHNNWYLLITFLLFWPAALYGLYKRSDNKKTLKIVYLTLGCGIVLMALFNDSTIPSTTAKNNDQEEVQVIVQAYMNYHIKNPSGYESLGYQNFKTLYNDSGEVIGFSITHLYIGQITFGGSVRYKYAQDFRLDKNLNITYVYGATVIEGPL